MLPYKLPHPALQPYVMGYGQVEIAVPTGENYTQRIIPTGQMYLMFYRGEAVSARLGDGNAYTLPIDGSINGQATFCREMTLRGKVEMFGVQFRPAGFYALFGIPAQAFTDLSVDFEAALGTPGKDFSRRVTEAAGWPEQIALTEEFLLRQLRQRHHPPGCLPEALGTIHCTQGKLKVELLSERLGVSRRTLARQFGENVGIPAKMYARTIRFNALLNAIRTASRPLQWLDLVHQYGYFDQSHLINDFALFTGRAPREFLGTQTDFDRYQLAHLRGQRI